MRDTVLGAFEHQELPFEKLAEALHPERRGTEIPFLQVMFSMEHALDEHLELPGLSFKLIEVDTGTAKFDLTWVVRELHGTFQVCVEYATDRFDQESVRQMLRHWPILLDQLITHPELCLSQVPLISPAERERLLTAWNPSRSLLPRVCNSCGVV